MSENQEYSRKHPSDLSNPSGPPNSPVAVLIDATNSPYNLSIASARTCYSAKGIVTPEDVSATPRAKELRDRIAKSTLQAGHLTTRQHPNFVFAISGVSRHLVWSFLHSHPYYNSEQVSQRYVEVKEGAWYIPESLNHKNKINARKKYVEALKIGSDAYSLLTEKLMPVASREYFGVYRGREKQPEKWEKEIKRKAMEAARYALTVSMHTCLYHTINGLTLHRYHRLSGIFDVPDETKTLIGIMTEQVRKADPDFVAEFYDPLPIEETEEYQFFKQNFGCDESGRIRWDRTKAKKFTKEFDEKLEGRYSRLAGFNIASPELMADSVRAVLGASKDVLSDSEAVEFLLNPARNRRLQSTLNEASMSKLSRCMNHCHYTFQKKISHTADSQDQRHRTVPGSRPVFMSHFTGEADYITPLIIKSDNEIYDIYAKSMDDLFRKITDFLEAGGSMEEAQYLLPNSFPIRFYESGDLLNLHHKWKSRTCFNAQEEIFFASVEEISQIEKIHPEIARWMRPPCWIRKHSGTKPFCPEGDRFCGIPVWGLEPEEYRRVI